MPLETPFQLHVSDIDLENLHHKLRLTRFPDELADEDWDYGVPLADVRRLVARWQTGFDWRSCERAINDIPQYTRDVDVDGFGTLHVHYVHQRSELDAAVPLLFVHGCKSFRADCDLSGCANTSRQSQGRVTFSKRANYWFLCRRGPRRIQASMSSL